MDNDVCELCGVRIGSLSEKGLRQHLKSKPHKYALKHGRSVSKAKEDIVVQCILHSEDTDVPWTHSEDLENLSVVPDEQSILNVCIPPLVSNNPKKLMKAGMPFLTFKSIPSDREEDLELDLSELLEKCCKAGGRRVPNLDLGGCNKKVESFSEALSLLRNALSSGQPFWTSLQADSEVIHPEWWPGGQMVPTYTNVLITQGENGGIGMHVDVDHYAKKGPVIDTYLTIIKGSKQVILFPPNGLTYQDCISSAEFPHEMSLDLIRSITGNKGFYFQLHAIDKPMTLFIPRGWHHWLSSSSPQTIAFTASTY